MARYTVRVWYTVPRWKEIEIDAPDERTAYNIGAQMLEISDTNEWSEWDDAETQIDVERIA
jgi:hypothetical protein